MPRLIGDMALGIAKLGLRAHEGAMREQWEPDAVLAALLAEI